MQIQIKSHKKTAQDFAIIHKWDNLKKNLPPKLKLSSFTIIPHKSQSTGPSSICHLPSKLIDTAYPWSIMHPKIAHQWS